ncbi:WD40 repeat-like protein [Wallemia mellicola]|nr:WD40 repeat-like protein [Wallemia mellicola]
MSSATYQRQRILIEDFRQITNTNSDTAQRFLKVNGWRFDDALDEYFANPPIQVNKSNLNKVWNKYKDADDDNLMSVPDGLIQYGEDLGIDLTSENALALAQLCGATLQAENWPKESWTAGWSIVGGDSIDKQKQYMETTTEKLKEDGAYFTQVYSHTFELGKGQGARILTFEDAKAYWSILLAHHLGDDDGSAPSKSLVKEDGSPCEFTKKHLEIWFGFLEEQKVAVTKDTWLEFLNFIRSIDGHFSTFDEAAAWPSLIDDFVEHFRISLVTCSSFSTTTMSFTESAPPQSIETGHQDVIHDAQLDYYGKRLATASSDRTIKITDITDAPSSTYTNSNAVILQGHQGPVWQVAWAHPKYGSILASSSYDGKVFIWKQEGANWTRIKDHTLHTSSVNSISWAPHELGPTLACASSDGNVSVLTFHNDGTWDASMLAAHKLGVTSVSWAPASSNSNITAPGSANASALSHKLVTGGCDSLIKIWSLNSETKQWQCDDTLQTHTDWVRDIAWSPNVGLSKQYIASASQDKTVYVHTQQIANGEWSSTKIDYDFKDTVWRLSWSLSGNVLAVSAGDGKVTLWKENLEGVFELLTYVCDAILPLIASHDTMMNEAIHRRSIMLAWTLDPAAQTALEYYITTLAMPHDLVHIVNVDTKGTGNLELELKERINQLETQVAEGIQVISHTLSGETSSALVEFADKYSPDMVVLGRRNLGHWKRIASDEGFSLSSHLATHIESPVVIVKFYKD